MNFHFFLIVAAVIGSSHSFHYPWGEPFHSQEPYPSQVPSQEPYPSQVPSQEPSQEPCLGEWRRPEYTDIEVTCGTNSIRLAIQACPIFYTGYNETLLIVNHISDPACKGTLDTSVSPPVVRFSFPLNKTHACGSVFRTASAPGTGVFSDLSNIQTIIVSGVVRASDPTTGPITYKAELKYYYSCAYPLQYLINNTQVDLSAQI